MGRHEPVSAFERWHVKIPTARGIISSIVRAQLEFTASMTHALASMNLMFQGYDFGKHLNDIMKTLEAYDREENLSPRMSAGFESMFDIFKLSENISNPYHIFIEGQRARKAFFEIALSQIKGITSVNPSLSPFFQQAENFCRTNLAFTFTFERPEWNLEHESKEVADLDFCKIVNFAPETGKENGRNMFLVAPMSGHFATLLRKTIESLTKAGYNVFITDWKSPFDVPKSKGELTVDRYTKEVQNSYAAIQKHIGSDVFDVLAVCQPGPETLTATAHAQKYDLPGPRSISLMASPIDISKSPTQVNDAGKKLSPDVLEKLKFKIPHGFTGAGRDVYPAPLQICGFIMTNIEDHMNKFMKLAFKRSPLDQEEEKMIAFYTEYFAVMDLDWKFYEQTVQRVFQSNEWASGKVRYNDGNKDEIIDFAQMTIPLMTFEALNDDITGLRQTEFAHEIAPNTKIFDKKQHLVVEADIDDVDEHGKRKKVGHYGIFAGRYFRSKVLKMMDDIFKKFEGAH